MGRNWKPETLEPGQVIGLFLADRELYAVCSTFENAKALDARWHEEPWCTMDGDLRWEVINLDEEWLG